MSQNLKIEKDQRVSPNLKTEKRSMCVTKSKDKKRHMCHDFRKEAFPVLPQKKTKKKKKTKTVSIKRRKVQYQLAAGVRIDETKGSTPESPYRTYTPII